MYTKDQESLPKPGTSGDTTAWLMDRRLGKIVLHNRCQGAKSANVAGFRKWRSCATGEIRDNL